MSKKIVVIDGDSTSLTAALAAAIGDGNKLFNNIIVMTDSDAPTTVLDESNMTVGIHQDVYESLRHEVDIYTAYERGIRRLHEDRVIRNYKLGESPVEQVEFFDLRDDLPTNTTKPKFLMERDHHIRSPRGRR